MQKKSKRVTDNRTYNIIRIKEEGFCCVRCQRRGRREWYYFYNRKVEYTRGYYKDRVINEGEGKYPSWKMVSKNKKQWQKKPFIFKTDWSNWDQNWDERTEIKW